MAGRSQRQLIKDRLEQAARNCDTAACKLIEVQERYLAAGEERGLELEPILGAIGDIRNAIARYRIERT